MPLLQLAPTEDLLAEFSRRYPNCLLVFEIPANGPGQDGRIQVCARGPIHVTMGLAEYARVSLANAALNSQHPHAGPY